VPVERCQFGFVPSEPGEKALFEIGLPGEFAMFGCVWEMMLNVIFLASSDCSYI